VTGTAVAKEAVAGQERLQLRAFVADDETRSVVEQVVGDLMIPAAAIHRGRIDDAIQLLGRQRSPRVLLVDISACELPLSAVNELAEVCEPGVSVIAIGDRNDVGLFRELINHGISDYLVKPITPSLLQRSLLTVVEGGGQHNRQTDRDFDQSTARKGPARQDPGNRCPEEERQANRRQTGQEREAEGIEKERVARVPNHIADTERADEQRDERRDQEAERDNDRDQEKETTRIHPG